MGPFSESGIWQPQDLKGVKRFLNRVWELQDKVEDKESPESVKRKVHRTIKKVGEDIERFKFNTAISALMVLLNDFEDCSFVAKEDFDLFLRLLAPLAPHISEELWQKEISDSEEFESIFEQPWPGYDPQLLQKQRIELVIQVNGRVRGDVEVDPGVDKQQAQQKAQQVENVKHYLDQGRVKRVVFVPDKFD